MLIPYVNLARHTLNVVNKHDEIVILTSDASQVLDTTDVFFYISI